MASATAAVRLSASLLLVIAVLALISVAAEAVKCSSGRGLNKKGECELCPLGTYSRGGTNARCIPCAPGTSAPLGSRSRFNCKKCQGVTYGKGGQCIPCPAGSYVDAWGSLKCKRCTKLVGVGHLSMFGCRWHVICRPGMGSFLRQCPDGSCWVNSKQCCVNRRDGKTCVEKFTGTCPAGFGIETDTCAKCPRRTYRPLDTSPRKCQLCPIGTEPAPAGNRTFCKPCPSRYYNNKPGAPCTICPRGTYSLQISKTVGPTKCIACNKRRLFKDVLSPKCGDYVTCQPGYSPKKGTRCFTRCFDEGKQCCVKPGTRQCLEVLN